MIILVIKKMENQIFIHLGERNTMITSPDLFCNPIRNLTFFFSCGNSRGESIKLMFGYYLKCILVSLWDSNTNGIQGEIVIYL